MVNEDIKKLIETENIVINNGAFYKKHCLENCQHTTICKYCNHKMSKNLFDIIYSAIQHNQI